MMTPRVLWIEAGAVVFVVVLLAGVLVHLSRQRTRDQYKFERLVRLRDLIEAHGLNTQVGDGKNHTIFVSDSSGRQLVKIAVSDEHPDVYLINSSDQLHAGDGSDEGLIRLVYQALAELEIPPRQSALEGLFDSNG